MSKENDYFHAKNKDKLATARREKALEALKKAEIEAIQELFNTTHELAERVFHLGFDAESARILFLVPIIQVAWADGQLDKTEKERLLEIAHGRGVSEQEGGPAWTFFELLTVKRPSDSFFEQVAQLVSEILHDGGQHQSANIYENAVEMAHLSGGFLGIGNIHKDEKQLLDQFKHLFAVDSETASTPATTAGPVFITAELKVVDASKVEEARQALKSLELNSITEAGCLYYVVHQDPKDPTRFMTWERFVDEDAFKKHSTYNHYKEFSAKNLTQVEKIHVSYAI